MWDLQLYGGGIATQSCPTLCDPWTVAHQAPLFMGFSRQEYWSGLPLPSPRDLPNPGIEPGSPAFQADTLTSEPPGKPSTGIDRSNKQNRTPRNKRMYLWTCMHTCHVFKVTIQWKMKKMKLGHLLANYEKTGRKYYSSTITPYTKTNSRWHCKERT